MNKYAIGIDIGGTNTVFSLIDENANIIKEITNSTKLKTKEFIYSLLAGIKNLVDYATLEKKNISGIVIGFPGSVAEDGTVLFASNLKVNGINLKNELKDFNLPIYIENDANLIALGLHYSEKLKGNHFKNMVGITIGTGIGAGIIINDSLYRGFNCNAGEIGHIKIKQSDDNLRQCGCGDFGCFETFGSSTAILNIVKENLNDNINSNLKNYNELSTKIIFDEYKRGDNFTIDILENIFNDLAIGFANIINILNPEAIIIGGGVARAGKVLEDGIKKYLDNYCYKRALDGFKLIVSDIDNKALVYGTLSFFNNN